MTPLLATQALHCSFARPHGARVKAVDGVDLALAPGEALGLVGESGCGKSTLLRLLLRLQAAESGTIRFAGVDVTRATGRALAPLRRGVQAVFQNPHAALDPRASVFAAVAEPLRIQARLSRRALADRVQGLLHEVGLPAEFLWRYPHELSGGQKQRVCIARALAPGPKALLLDEPTSALDVSVQAQIIDLLAALREREGLAFLFVSHNLAVVRQLCDRVAVMNAGKVVEQGAADAVLAHPQHAYTRTLLRAVLPPRPRSLQGSTAPGQEAAR
ncbi:MAG: ABC transporter ATP-binding protein [Rhodospirillales bacterium]|nr:ABC transporter ATP-binding protein [Rhodospirillales bacterium]